MIRSTVAICKVFTVGICLAALVSSARAADPLQMTVTSLFEKVVPQSQSQPILVQLENDGAGAQGVIRLTSGSFSVEQAVDLPSGAKKKVVMYVPSDYQGINAVLSTNRGGVQKSFNPPYPSDQQSLILNITDSPGDMGFLQLALRGQGSVRNVVITRDAYVEPALAPTRSVGYKGFAAVMLGSGSERLSDEAVAALKMWAQTGGHIVFVGGASAPVLSDARWTDALPIKDARVKTIPQATYLADLSAEEAPGPISVVAGTPLPGVISLGDEEKYAYKRRYGVGAITLLALNPTEAPYNRWIGNRRAFLRLVDQYDVGRSTSYVGGGSVEVSTMGTGLVLGSTTARSMSPVAGPQFSSADPFSTKLPDGSFFVGILLGYLVLVIPVNFLILKKMKRGELAWITAPVLSLGFSVFLFQSAQSLYKAEASVASQGVVIFRQGSPDSFFVGQSQLFIPRSGGYNLKLRGVEAITNGGGVDEYSYQRDSGEPIFTVDNGSELEVPNLRVNNLAFRQLTVWQRLAMKPPVNIQAMPASDGRVEVRIANTGVYDLQDLRVNVAGQIETVKKLPVGKSHTYRIADVRPSRGVNLPGGGKDFAQARLIDNRGIQLQADMSEFEPGPKLGKTVEARQAIKLNYFVDGTDLPALQSLGGGGRP
jgi:hypothetical protein